MKNVVPLLLVVLMLVGAMNVVPFSVGAVEKEISVTTASSGDFEYIVLSDNTAEIISYSGSSSVLEIPSAIDRYTVTSVGNFVFSGNKALTEIVIPDTVIKIGASAFESCYLLSKVVFGDCVKYIGESAFEFCFGLSEITIPNSVVSIGKSAFESCHGIKKVTIGKLVKSIGDFAFLGCHKLSGVTIPETVTSIGTYAFGYYYDNLLNIYKNSDFTIFSYDDTEAELYAENEGLVFISLGEFPTENEGVLLIGDVDLDGNITVIDATMIQLHIAQITILEGDGFKCADSDKDGAISIIDATLIQQFVAELIPEL